MASWVPEPLVPELKVEKYSHILKPHIVTSKAGKYITVDGVECLNCATHNYLGLADHPRLEAAALEATHKYGCGSCGPRGFYGTMDVHLRLEEELANFLKVQEAVLYSYGFSTIASAIPAYAKSSDYVFVDELCNFAIQQGIVASRAKVLKFRHNDMRQLEELIESVNAEQVRRFGRPNKRRTFIVVEGIYGKTGDICPLREVVELKRKHRVRLFIDETLSFGVLGANGRGVTEHFNIDLDDVDLIVASLEHALCAYGGFCAGSTFIIDHQRLAGTGYCFSASLPPFQAKVALESLRMLSEDPNLVREAQELYRYAQDVASEKLTVLKNISDPQSPVKILLLTHSPFRGGAAPDQVKANGRSNGVSPNGTYKSDPHLDAGRYEAEELLLGRICDEVLVRDKIVITVARFLSEEEMTKPLPSIRLVIASCLSREDVVRVVSAIETRSANVVQSFWEESARTDEGRHTVKELGHATHF